MSAAGAPAWELAFAPASAEETQALGAALAGALAAGDLIVLTGELGAGKTTFTQGLGEGLGVRGAFCPAQWAPLSRRSVRALVTATYARRRSSCCWYARYASLNRLSAPPSGFALVAPPDSEA